MNTYTEYFFYKVLAGFISVYCLDEVVCLTAEQQISLPEIERFVKRAS
jgi:hypothetical protein